MVKIQGKAVDGPSSIRLDKSGDRLEERLRGIEVHPVAGVWKHDQAVVREMGGDSGFLVREADF